MNSIPLQEKANECQRMIRNISQELPSKLSALVQPFNLKGQDFNTLLKFIKENYSTLQPQFQANFSQNDVNVCIDVRNKLSHQVNTQIHFLNRALHSLRQCQKAFGIQSALVPLRVLACKTCDQVITRTAQPSVTYKNLAGQNEKVTRTYDVQSWVVGNAPADHASRENTWYPGWVWTRTFCSQCHTHIGYRFDWAPEDRVDLTNSRITYNLNPRQAMIVTYADGTVKDLTHVVSDGEVRRHRYGLLEKTLREVPQN